MKNKFLLPGIFLLAMAGGVGYFTLRAKPVSVVPTEERTDGEEKPAESVNLVLDFGDGEPLVYQKDFEEGETAFSLLAEMAEKNELEIETKEYDFGTLVEAIEGKRNSAERAWIYFVNGESGQVAADKQVLTAEDMVEWKYMKPEF